MPHITRMYFHTLLHTYIPVLVLCKKENTCAYVNTFSNIPLLAMHLRIIARPTTVGGNLFIKLVRKVEVYLQQTCNTSSKRI